MTNISKIPLSDFVIISLDHDISNHDLSLIEEAFLDLWNRSTGKFLGDADFKNHVYHWLESKKLKEYPKQELVDEVVDLMLDYMERIGEYDMIFSEN